MSGRYDARMVRLFSALLVLLVVALFAVLVAVSALPRRADTGPVYTPAQLRAALSHAVAHGTLQRWEGRVVRLRVAIMDIHSVSICAPRCGAPTTRYDLTAPVDTLSDAGDTWLLPDSQRSLLNALHSLPLIGVLIPAPTVVAIGVEAVYRVRLRSTPDAVDCGPFWCLNAILLDATPPSGP